eukprot:m.23251 g.23251  ORF g.23251 m.23251 type:complete len:93 (-) comp11355_c0_seq1:827-1105(-)
MPARPASSTTVGSGNSAGSSSSGAVSRRPGGSVARKRTSTSKSKAPTNNAGNWQVYTEDSPGLKIGPVPVLVMSLVFIASVFMLHIWAKFTK